MKNDIEKGAESAALLAIHKKAVEKANLADRERWEAFDNWRDARDAEWREANPEESKEVDYVNSLHDEWQRRKKALRDLESPPPKDLID